MPHKVSEYQNRSEPKGSPPHGGINRQWGLADVVERVEGLLESLFIQGFGWKT